MNRVSKRLLCAGLLVAATAAVVPTVTASAEPPESPPIHSDDVRGHRQVDTSPALAAPVVVNGNGIDYHGGAVMRGQINAYVIWYGNWTNATKKGIIETFLNGIGGSPYFNINTGYGDPAGNVSGAVSYAGSTTDAYSQGKRNLSDTAIKRIVTSAITGNKLAKDPNGVYFVLTSSDVTKSGFLTQYCGWHTHSTISSTDVKYSFVGDPTGTRLSSCAAQTVSPNGDAGADAMVSVIAHELEETASDPGLNAWYDSAGAENADKCAWTFGTTTALANGAKYNMTLASKNFLIQQNWVNALGGYCALA
jgi:hypothetical protein